MEARSKRKGPIGIFLDYIRENPTWAMPFVLLTAQILAAIACFLIWRSR